MIIRLRLISISFLLFLSCSPSKNLPGQQSFPKSYVSQVPDGLIYKASFTYKEYNFSGLMIIKPERYDIRIALLSELGPTIMSFRLSSKAMEVIDMADVLKKKLVLKQLENDLRLVTLAGLHQNQLIRFKKEVNGLNKFKIKGQEHITVHSMDHGKVLMARRKGISFDTATAEFHFRDDDLIPNQIILKHSLVDLSLKLDFIEQN